LAWTIEFDRAALSELRRLDPVAARRIVEYLRERISPSQDPRRFGKALRGERANFWRYRVGDYRIICQIDDKRSTVVVLAAGHRREIYR